MVTRTSLPARETPYLDTLQAQLQSLQRTRSSSSNSSPTLQSSRRSSTRSSPDMIPGRPHRDVNKFEALRAFLFIVAVVLSIVPIIYGATLITVDMVWQPERSAMSIPGAPVTWGVFVLAVGVSTFVTSLRPRWSQYYSWSLRTMCLIWSVLSVTFFVDMVTDLGSMAILPVAFSASMAILSAGASALEDSWRS